MIDSSKKCKHQLAYELQSLCVFEKCSKLTCSRWPTPDLMFLVASAYMYTVQCK